MQSAISTVFGRCAYFALLEDGTQDPSFVQNQASQENHGAGTAAAQAMLDWKVDVLIAPPLGPKASQVLQNSNIQHYLPQGQTIKETLSLYHEGKLQKYSK